MVSSSAYGVTHPPRSNPPLRSSSAPPRPCITPSTVKLVVVVSFMRAVPLSFHARGNPTSYPDRCSLHGDDDLAGRVALFEMGDRVCRLGEREGSTDHGRDLLLFDHHAQRIEVLAILLRDERAQAWAREERQQRPTQDPAEESAGPVAAAVATDDH